MDPRRGAERSIVVVSLDVNGANLAGLSGANVNLRVTVGGSTAQLLTTGGAFQHVYSMYPSTERHRVRRWVLVNDDTVAQIGREWSVRGINLSHIISRSLNLPGFGEICMWYKREPLLPPPIVAVRYPDVVEINPVAVAHIDDACLIR